MSLVNLSALEMREGLLKGDFSSCELIDAHIERIEKTNPEYNSFLHTCFAEAREKAKKADKLLHTEKEAAPLLSGIPLSVKDLIITKDIPTTCGSKMLESFVPPYQATAMEKLEEAGAINLGKTNLDEFGMGSSNENSAFGAVLNPWGENCVPGGSSGGAATSVALGQNPIAIATDTGGSIRQPAAFTGTVGLRPTYGRVSRYGLVAYASSLDQIGVIARSVSDCAMTLEIVSGYDPRDSTSMELDVPDFLQVALSTREDFVKGLKIGLPKEYFADNLNSEIGAKVQELVSKLQALGAEIVDISLPHTEEALAAYYIIVPAEASSNLARYDGVRYGHRSKHASSLEELYTLSRSEGFGDEVKRRILIGTYVLSAGYYDQYYHKAQQVRTLVINDFKQAFSEKCDLILTPTSPTTAFKLGERTSSPVEMYNSDIYTTPSSLAGLPGISLPLGLDSQQLPIGVQLLAAPFCESKLLMAAAVIENKAQFSTSTKTLETNE